ncbi:MAG TPA: amidase family protein, partial [Oceanipulchritudo sp.]|nr:amidase family protein [Oceanipulchritudo sp.]
ETASSIPESEKEAALDALGMSPEADNPIDRAHYRGARTTMRGYTEVLTRRDSLIRSLETFLATRDVLLCPVTSGTAFPHCPPGGTLELDGLTVSYALGGGIGFTSPFNLTGNPVVVLPLGLASNGLPVGIQLVGKRWEERRLLAVARALEALIGGA